MASDAASPSALSDPWVQVFASLALVSGAMTAHWAVTGGIRASSPLAPTALSSAAPSDPPPAVGPNPSLPAQPAAPQAAQGAPAALAAAPAAPQATGAGISMMVKAKVPGHWVVDVAMGKDADRAGLADVLASAQDGDVVTVRPGVYRETLAISKSVTIQGSGAGPEAVQLDASGPTTAAIAAGRVVLRNLQLTNFGTQYATVLSVGRAEARLENVQIKTIGQGLRVSRGSSEVYDSELSGRIAVVGEEGARFKAVGTKITGSDIGGLFKGDGLDIDLERDHFLESERAVNVEGRSRLKLRSCDFALTGAGGAVFLFNGAEADVSGARIDLRHSSRVGLYVQGATLSADDVRVEGSSRSGVIVTGDATATLRRAQILGNASAGLVADKSSRAFLSDSTFSRNGDCGFQINDASVELKRVRAEKNRCGAGFYGPGRLSATGCNFKGNSLGGLAVTPGLENGIVLQSEDNEGIPKRIASGGEAAAAPRSGRTVFSNDVFSHALFPDGGRRR